MTRAVRSLVALSLLMGFCPGLAIAPPRSGLVAPAVSPAGHPAPSGAPRALAAASPLPSPAVPTAVPSRSAPAPSPRATAGASTPAPRPGASVGALVSKTSVAGSTPAPVAILRGTASWGDGWTGVVTRLPRGTRIRVCGPLGCWSGRSVGYGPAVRTGRIADLSRAVFASVCGDPSIGLCRVSLEVLR